MPLAEFWPPVPQTRARVYEHARVLSKRSVRAERAQGFNISSRVGQRQRGSILASAHGYHGDTGARPPARPPHTFALTRESARKSELSRLQEYTACCELVVVVCTARVYGRGIGRLPARPAGKSCAPCCIAGSDWRARCSRHCASCSGMPSCPRAARTTWYQCAASHPPPPLPLSHDLI